MKVKRLVVSAILVIIMFMGVFGLAYYNKASMNNPMSQYSSLLDLQRSVNFDFMVPEMVAKSNDAKMYSYLGQIVEVVTNEFTFRAGKTVGENADISGEYKTFDIDKKYTANQSDLGTINARYRTDNKICIINMSVSGMDYSIKFNSYKDERDAFESFGINFDALIEDKHTDSTEVDSTIGSDQTLTDSTIEDKNDVKFIKIENGDLGIEFFIADTVNSISQVYSNNELAILLDNKLVFVVEYYPDGNSSIEYNGYSVYKPDNNFVIRYAVKNPFEQGSDLYNDYYTIIENIDTVVNTFNTLD